MLGTLEINNKESLKDFNCYPIIPELSPVIISFSGKNLKISMQVVNIKETRIDNLDSSI